MGPFSIRCGAALALFLQHAYWSEPGQCAKLALYALD